MVRRETENTGRNRRENERERERERGEGEKGIEKGVRKRWTVIGQGNSEYRGRERKRSPEGEQEIFALCSRIFHSD